MRLRNTRQQTNLYRAAQRRKVELAIARELPTHGVQGFTFTDKTITVKVASESIGMQLPHSVQGRSVHFVVVEN
jgi:hypothetical protein